MIKHCLWCVSPINDDLKDHVSTHHPEVDEIDYQLALARNRHPDIDIQKLASLYIDKKETVFGLRHYNIHIEDYLRSIGALRTIEEDEVIRGDAELFVATKKLEDKLIFGNSIRISISESKFGELTQPIITGIENNNIIEEAHIQLKAELAYLKKKEKEMLKTTI